MSSNNEIENKENNVKVESKEEKKFDFSSILKNKVYLAIAIAIFVVICIVTGLLIYNNKDNDNNEKNNNSKYEYSDLSEWNGVYSNGSSIITIYQTSLKELSVVLSASNGKETVDVNYLSGTNNNVIEAEAQGTNNGKIQITKTKDGLDVKYYAKENQDKYNFINGKYKRNSKSNGKYDGFYYNDDGYAIISSVSESLTYINIIANSSILGTYFQSGDNLSNNQIKIEKNDKGIKVIANNKNDIYKKIEGEYYK